MQATGIQQCQQAYLASTKLPQSFYIKNWASPASFIVCFRSFQTNITIFTTVYVKKCQSSIWCRDLNQ